MPRSSSSRGAGAPAAGRRATLAVVAPPRDPREEFYDALADDLAGRVEGVRTDVMRAAFRLVTTYDAVKHFLAARIEERGLSLATFNLLLVLSQTPGGVAVGELTLQLLVTRQNVSVLVRGLERRRLVRRVVDRGDKRVRRIAITAAGTALLDAVLPEHLARVGGVMQGLDAADLRGLAALLDRIRAAVPGDAPVNAPRARRRASRAG